MGSGSSKSKPVSSPAPQTSPDTHQSTNPTLATPASPQQSENPKQGSSSAVQQSDTDSSMPPSSKDTEKNPAPPPSTEKTHAESTSPKNSAASTLQQQQHGAGDNATTVAAAVPAQTSASGGARPGSESSGDKSCGPQVKDGSASQQSAHSAVKDADQAAVTKVSVQQDKGRQTNPKAGMATAEDESVLPLAPEHQRKFDTTLRATNLLVNQDSLMSSANKNVTKLALKRMLPEHISLGNLMSKLENLQVLDVSSNNLGPQGVRALCLALPSCSSVVSLSIADNKTDTDTAESVGRLLSQGPALVYLDVSGNYLGKDYFSRCVGQALKTNTTLQTLRAQSIGMVDATVLLEGLEENSTLVELDLANNQLTDRKALGAAMAAMLKKADCSLQSLSLSGCNMNAEGVKLLTEGLAANSSLLALNLNNNEARPQQVQQQYQHQPPSLSSHQEFPPLPRNRSRSDSNSLLRAKTPHYSPRSAHPPFDLYSEPQHPPPPRYSPASPQLNFPAQRPLGAFGSLQTLTDLVAVALSHPGLVNLHVNDARIQETNVHVTSRTSTDSTSKLQVLSLHSSNVNDEFFSKLSSTFKGNLLSLLDVDLSNNTKLSAAAVESLWSLTADENGHSSIRKLTTAMTEMNALPAPLTAEKFPNMSYLNVRKMRFSPDGFSAFAEVVSPAGLPLTTLVLDGMKLSGKKGLPALFDHCPSSHVTALSLSGCSLTDADLSPLMEALKSGFKVHMLKLSANRLTDASLKSVSESLQRLASHPLSVLDVSGNQITDVGVKDLCTVYTNKKHASSLHSLNLATNAIGREGVLCLMACMGGKLPLKCLYVNNQTTSFLETDVMEIHEKLVSVLGYTVKRSGETIERGCSNLPSLPEGLHINMCGLGGHSGELGPFLDCPAITTDSSSKRATSLTLQNILDICGSLQGQKDGKCVLSSEDWTHVIGADKDNSIPTWLQLEDSRSKAVYLSNLPGNSTAQRLEALFEMEADCNIDEVFLVKDPVTKNNSGTAWLLFSDETSVNRALAIYNNGEAQVFGTPFTVSRLQVTVQETASSDVSAKARQELAARQRARAAEDRAHRLLIQQNTEESWKRHSYRLAHPAYADGRIW